VKKDYYLDYISKEEAKGILEKHHYLSVKKISKDFKSGVNIGLFFGGVPINDGLFFGGELVGVCIFTGLPVPELSVSMFGLSRDEQEGLFELSRLCLLPHHQKTEHNITSWFTSRALKKIKKDHSARCVLSYADIDHHEGTIYKACNFGYYGETAKKKDFFILNSNGLHTKMSRGKTSGIDGEWRDRSRKKRYVILYDKKLELKWTRTP
jgi:hypothetical protein